MVYHINNTVEEEGIESINFAKKSLRKFSTAQRMLEGWVAHKLHGWHNNHLTGDSLAPVSSAQEGFFSGDSLTGKLRCLGESRSRFHLLLSA